MDREDRTLFVRFVEAAEKIAAALEAQTKPAIVAPDVVTAGERTVDGFPRPIKEPT